MGYKAYLQCGANKLHLDANPYELAFGFVPPAVTETPNIGIGTSANQYGGGKLISKRTESGAYSFSVRVMGSSNAHNEALIDRLDRFIRSGTEAEPVYFCWRPADNVDFEPLYGQWNATRRAKVITGSVYKSGEYYSRGTIRESAIFADVNMVINPPEGKRQRVATATGGIIENTIGTTDGVSRGVIVAEATTNVITNPIFGHATPLNDWTVGADTIGEVITDGDYVLFGENAVRLTRKTSGSTFSFYQSINVGNTNTWCLSCYAKKPDGSAVTSSDIQLRYGGTTSAPSFQAVGNGWYRAWKTFTGIASAQVTGFTPILAGASIYVDGWQFEEKAHPTPLAYGDLLGCAWASTAHDSTTTRTAGSLKIPASECVTTTDFTWWIAFRMNMAAAERSGSLSLLFETATNTSVYMDASTGQLVFSDGTNLAAGAAATVAKGDIIIAHVTMNSAGMKIYKNGAADGAGQATFVPLVSPTFLYVGSSDSTTQHPDCTILGAGTYNRALTAAEIALDYANMLQAAQGMDEYGGRVDWLPYLWTQAGDNVVENCDGATYDNWCVVGSVPGSVPAVTRIDATVSDGFDDNYQVNLSCPALPYNNFVSPSLWLNCDVAGTAAVGTTQGDAFGTVSVTTYMTELLTFTPPSDYPDALKGREYYLYARVWDEGSGLFLRHDLNLGSSITTTGAISYPSAAEWRMMQLPKIAAWGANEMFSDVTQWIPSIALYASRTSGTAVVRTDFIQIMPRPFVKIYDNTTSWGRFIYEKDKALICEVSGSTLFPNVVPAVTGDTIEMVPNAYNELVSIAGNSELDTLITTTLTYNSMYVTPRWALA